MHKEYILLDGFWKAKKGFTAGFHVPLTHAAHLFFGACNFSNLLGQWRQRGLIIIYSVHTIFYYL